MKPTNLESNVQDLDNRFVYLEKRFSERINNVEESLLLFKYQINAIKPTDGLAGTESTELNKFEQKEINVSKSYFSEFWNSLSMPGLKFIARSGNHLTPWVVIHLLSLLISLFYIKNAYKNWQTSPVVLTLSNKLLNVNNLPSPAITICVPDIPGSKYNTTESFTKCILFCNRTSLDDDICYKSKKCKYTELDTLNLAFEKCRSAFNLPKVFDSSLFMYQERFQISNHTIKGIEFYSHMEKLREEEFPFLTLFGPSHKDTFLRFDTFSGIQICRTYNSLMHENIYKEGVSTPIPLKNIETRDSGWKVEDMLEFKGSTNTLPVYGGNSIALRLYKIKNENEAECRSTERYRNSIGIHSQSDIPVTKSISRVLFEWNSSIELLLTPRLTITDKGLALYDPIQRGCSFSFENNLAMFKFYTKTNCEIECLVNCHLNACNCVPYYLPRHNESIDICIGFCKPTCECSCLPDCTQLTYDIESVDLKDVQVINDGAGELQISVSYKELDFYPTIRYGINSLSEFIAYSLGMVGVFNGFCVMVTWELIYLLTVGLWTYVRSFWS